MSGCFISLRALVSASLPHAVMADCAPAPWSAFNDVEDQLLRSLPPSQDYQTPSDTALLGSTFPQLLLTFTEAEAVKLVLLGLRDADAIACITHGFNRSSAAAASQLNPVDAVFRMAADMSGCFTSSRALVSTSLPDATVPSASPAAQPARPPSTPLLSAAHPVSAASTATVAAAFVVAALCVTAFFKWRRQ